MFICNSVDISKRFEQRHDRVLRDIETFIKNNKNNESVFCLSNTKDSYGRKRKCYKMNEEGLILLSNKYKNRKEQNKPNSIYVAKQKGNNEYFKIGMTGDIEKRVRYLNAGSPTGIEVVVLLEVKDAKSIEKYLHSKFEKYRTNGEWFKVELEKIKLAIKELGLWN